MSIEHVVKQVDAINPRFQHALFGLRSFESIGDPRACKGCGYGYAVTSYRYHDSDVVEFVCHDCAWPKNGDYLREKEEKRQKEQAEKEKREKWRLQEISRDLQHAREQIRQYDCSTEED